MARYILKVERYSPGQNPGHVHIGYIDYKFPSQEEAGYFYYDQYPGHRAINKLGTWTSDWGLSDSLRYKVIPYTNQDLKEKNEAYPDAVAKIDALNAEVLTKYFRPWEYVRPAIDWEAMWSSY